MKPAQSFIEPSQAAQKEKEKPLRALMPDVSLFLDSMREAFGRETIDRSIRLGLRGEPTFYAEEGGVSIGTRQPRGGITVYLDPVSGATIAEPDR